MTTIDEYLVRARQQDLLRAACAHVLWRAHAAPVAPPTGVLFPLSH